MKIFFIFVISCMLGVASAAGIYKWVDSQGVVHYGDEPGQGSAEKMGRLPGLSTYAPSPIKVEAEETQKDEGESVEVEEESSNYRSLSIVKPESGESIRSNPGIVEIFVALAPALGKTDHLRLLLDGKLLNSKYKKTVIQLENVDRGEHQLSVAVFSNRGVKLMESATHTFYLHRVTALKKSPRG